MTLIELGNKIKERRKQLRVTQTHLAEMADISVRTIQKIELGKANPTINVLNNIVKVLGFELKLEIKK